MQVNMTECCGSSDSEVFMNIMFEYKSIWSYVATLLLLDEYEFHGCGIDGLFIPIYFTLSFGGNKYTIVFDGELTDEADDVLDIMLAYSKDSHTFDFIQDNIKIDVDIFEKELVIEIEEKE